MPASRRNRLRDAGDVAALGQPARRARRRARRSGAGIRSRRAGDGVGDVALIAGEGLVAAVAVERDGDVPAGQLGEVEARDRRGVGERLAVVADDLRQDLDRVGADQELLVLGAEVLARSRARAAARRSRSWSKPIENVRTGSGESCAIAATTAEESIPPERNAPSGTSAISRLRVASSSAARIRSHELLDRRVELARVVELPVALERDLAVAEQQRVRRRQLATPRSAERGAGT